jgi:metalloendopeptidase OMA1, mitochondrial
LGSPGGGSRWYEDRRVQAAAAGVGAAAYTFFCCRKETVPYTNRTRYIILSPNAERRLGEFLFELEKSKLRSKILPPDDPATVRVRRIAMKIIRAVNHGLAVDAIEATRGYGDGIPTDSTIKNRDDVEDGSPSENAIAAAQQGGAHQANLEGLNWEVIVVKDKMINAMCVPGGKIIVYTGLLDRFKEDVEVATVLGHEVGFMCNLLADCSGLKLITTLPLFFCRSATLLQGTPQSSSPRTYGYWSWRLSSCSSCPFLTMR